MPVERESKVPDDPVDAFVQRALNGSKGGAKILADALKLDLALLARVVPLLTHEKPNVKAGAAEALQEVAPGNAAVLAPHAATFVSGLASSTSDSRAMEAILRAFNDVVPLVPESLDGAGVKVLEGVLAKRPKPELAEAVYMVLGRWGGTSPERSAAILPLLARGLSGKPREPVAKALLLAAGDLARGPGAADARKAVRDAVAPLRGHPSPLVRERASKLVVELDKPA